MVKGKKKRSIPPSRGAEIVGWENIAQALGSSFLPYRKNEETADRSRRVERFFQKIKAAGLSFLGPEGVYAPFTKRGKYCITTKEVIWLITLDYCFRHKSLLPQNFIARANTAIRFGGFFFIKKSEFERFDHQLKRKKHTKLQRKYRKERIDILHSMRKSIERKEGRKTQIENSYFPRFIALNNKKRRSKRKYLYSADKGELYE